MEYQLCKSREDHRYMTAWCQVVFSSPYLFRVKCSFVLFTICDSFFLTTKSTSTFCHVEYPKLGLPIFLEYSNLCITTEALPYAVIGGRAWGNLPIKES